MRPFVTATPPGARAIDFLVMQLDSRVTARVQVPLAMTFHEIGRDYVLGSYFAANDEPHVVVLGLKR